MTEQDMPDQAAVPVPALKGGRSHDDSLWAIVLAGGEGVRLRPLVRQICGDERPKQYVPLLESRSLLAQTVDRLPPLIAPEHTVLVTMRTHVGYLAPIIGTLPRRHVLAQPADRGTAAAILLAAHWILARDSDATVVLVPSDHLVVEEALFMRHVGTVARFVYRRPGWMVLLGAQPTAPEPEYGWIEPGPRVGWTTEGPLYRISRFWEKPSPELVATLYVGGCLWNTFVVVGRARALVEAGAACVPELEERLRRLSGFFGTELERWAMEQAYALAPRANFSRAVLERCPLPLAVSKLPALTWCDLGSPARVVEAMGRLGLSPAWMRRASAV